MNFRIVQVIDLTCGTVAIWPHDPASSTPWSGTRTCCKRRQDETPMHIIKSKFRYCTAWLAIPEPWRHLVWSTLHMHRHHQMLLSSEIMGSVTQHTSTYRQKVGSPNRIPWSWNLVHEPSRLNGFASLLSASRAPTWVLIASDRMAKSRSVTLILPSVAPYWLYSWLYLYIHT